MGYLKRMSHSKDEAACASCGEVGWFRVLEKAVGKHRVGAKLCRTCYKELVEGAINPQTQYRVGNRIVTRHTDNEK